jgi:protocatechuate 3,4-dioxygenase beta subunit
MLTKKMFAVMAVAISATILVLGPGRSGDAANGEGRQPAANDAPAKEAQATAKPQAAGPIRGKLVDADGKPLADVAVRVWSFRNGNNIPEPVTKTAADGTFRFEADPKDAIEEARVVLTPPGKPAQWLPLSKFAKEQTLRVPADDVAFTGQVATLENQPLKGVTVEVVRVSNVSEGELPGWLDKNVAMRKESYWLNEGGLVTLPGGLVTVTTKATTDAEGKFKLTGIGRGRVLTVKVYGPNLEMKFFWTVTVPGGPKEGYIRTRDFNHGVYGPDVTVMLAPSRPLVGMVRDAKTGKPVVGVIISEVNAHVPKAVTDKDGKYRLEGVPKKSHYGLNVCGQKGRPYFDHTHTWVADVAGLDPLETNLNINRGVEVTGRVVDKRGRPVRAEVFYEPLDSNPNVVKPDGGTVFTSDGWKTKPDGTFYLTAWPGKGVLSVLADDGNRFATVDARSILNKLGVRSRPIGDVHAVIPIDVDEAKPESSALTLTLEDGMIRKGAVVGVDDKPVDGVIAAGLREGPLALMKSSEFTVGGMGASSRRLLLFMDTEKKLGALQPVVGAETDALRVTLRPLATVTGELRKADKEPWEKLTVTAVPFVPEGDAYDNLPHDVLKNQGVYGMIQAPWWKLTKRVATTDEKGRFRLEGLLPGLEYTIFVSDGDLGEPDTLVTSKQKIKVESGKTTDLGTLMKAKR